MNNNHNGNNQFDSVYFKNYLASAKKSKLDVKELLLFLGSLCFVGGLVCGITYLLNNKSLRNESSMNDFIIESSNLSDSYISTETKKAEEEIVPIDVEETVQAKFLDECSIIDSDRYTGNEGDSFVYPIGKHEGTRGNTCVDGLSYEHGLEGWIARWNYANELSWAYSIFDIGGKYKSLSGKFELIQSYNTTDFNTTLEFWGDDKLIQSYTLTPDIIPFEINLDVTNCNSLKVYFYDNEAKSGGTSFGLLNMLLSTEAASKVNTSNEKADIVNCYTGSYAAGQGDTQLDFTITDCDSDYNADALFLFYASDSNPSVPTGSYKMKGSLVEKYDDGSIKMYFEGTEWIQQPSTYGFVNFTAIVDPSNGTISSPDYSIELVQKKDNINNSFNGHQYCLFNAPMDAEEAEITCKAMGGHLASINSSEEQQHFEDIIKNSNQSNIWTGGYYDGKSWIWTDGSEFVYSNWDDEKPDNYWGDEYYIKVATRDIDFETWSMYKNKWDDVSKVADGNSGDVPTSSFGFVCEWNQ